MFVVSCNDVVDFGRLVESVDFEKILDGFVWLIHPKLVKIIDRGVITRTVVGAS